MNLFICLERLLKSIKYFFPMFVFHIFVSYGIDDWHQTLNLNHVLFMSVKNFILKCFLWRCNFRLFIFSCFFQVVSKSFLDLLGVHFSDVVVFPFLFLIFEIYIIIPELVSTIKFFLQVFKLFIGWRRVTHKPLNSFKFIIFLFKPFDSGVDLFKSIKYLFVRSWTCWS